MRDKIANLIYEQGMKMHATYDIEDRTMTFKNEDLIGTLKLYEEGWLEFSIFNEDNKLLFYQQMETDEEQEEYYIACLQAFHDYLYVPEKRNGKSEFMPIDLKKGDVPKLLVTCTSGASSSYYASLIESNLEKLGVKVRVDAMNFLNLDEIQDRYDYILLSPQVSYKFAECQRKYGYKVFKIHPLNYATFNTSWIEDEVLQ